MIYSKTNTFYLPTLVALSVWGLGSCATTSTPSGTVAAPQALSSPSSPTVTKLQVVAAENFWGSLAAQLGGDKVQVTSIISNPNTDPHDYEPKPTDARTVADARYVILNGTGYDSWAQKLVDANSVSGRTVLNVGKLVGQKEGDNPHLWYSPNYVTKAIDQITADYKKLDPANATYYDQRHTQLLTVNLKDYTKTIAAIKQKYHGTPIGATESIFVYLASSLGLKLLTSPSFMNEVSEGTAPTSGDKSNFDKQLSQKQIKVLVYNSQNSTPDVEALKKKAQDFGIPIVSFTETLTPATASFQEWQTAQLNSLQDALNKAGGAK